MLHGAQAGRSASGRESCAPAALDDELNHLLVEVGKKLGGLGMAHQHECAKARPHRAAGGKPALVPQPLVLAQRGGDLAGLPERRKTRKARLVRGWCGRRASV
jgi:hypothetical protein